MPVTEIQLLRIYENLFGTTLMWQFPSPTYFPFPLPVFLMLLFFCLRDIKLVSFLICYLEHNTSSDFPQVFRVGALK